MEEEKKNSRPPLLPEHHLTSDFFVCDIFDAVPKADMASMEHPVFSLSSKPDRRIRKYESSDGTKFLEVRPSVDGLATVHDRDILIFCISQIMAALNEGRQVSKVVRFKAYDYFVATNRTLGGSSYARLKTSMERLRGTTISTNIVTGGVEQTEIFGLIDSAKIVRKTRDGRMQELEVTLADWVFNSIRAKEVLTLHKNYFRLRKPLERRLYEVVRKHCGKNAEWRIGLDKLQMKCGSSSERREFKRMVAQIIADDLKESYMPDYSISFTDEKRDVVIFRNRETMPKERKTALENFGNLDPETYHDARSVAPGYDVYDLERTWRIWVAEWLTEPPKHEAAAFIGFCKAYYNKRGDP